MGGAPGCLTYRVPVCKVLPLEGAHTHQWIPKTKVPQRGAGRGLRGAQGICSFHPQEGHFGPSEKPPTFPCEAQCDP